MAGVGEVSWSWRRGAALLLLFAFPATAPADPTPSVQLEPGTIRHVRMPAGALGWIGTLTVPATAKALSVALHGADDLDLFLRQGRPFSGDFANEAHLHRAAPAPMESVRVTGPLTAGQWFVAVVRNKPSTKASAFDILAMVDGPGDGTTLLPRTSERVGAMRKPTGVSARTWLPEKADAITFSFADGRLAANAPFRLVGPAGSTARTWTGPLTLRRGVFPAGLYTLVWAPAQARSMSDSLRLRVGLGTAEDNPPEARAPSIAPRLSFDRPLTVRLGGEGDDAWTFRLDVPQGTQGVVIEASTTAESDVDLFVNRGTDAPHDEEDADYFSRSTAPVERMFIGGDRPLPPGAYTGTAQLVDEHEVVTLTLRARRVTQRSRRRTWGSETPLRLEPGTWQRGMLEANESAIAWYFVTVPAGTNTLFVQTVDATAPVELVLVRRTDGSVMRRAMTARVDERLLVPFSPTPDTPRFFVLGVVARDPYDAHVDFRVAVSANTPLVPPSDLRWPPFLQPEKGRAIEEAAAAVVELTIDGNTGGTGTCVSPSGHILTCRHVLESEDGDNLQRRDILVAFSTRLDRPPVQSFLARVVEENEDWDLALLEITGDVFGRPVAKDVKFPHLPLGADVKLRLGDRVSVLGFPADGSDRSRTPVIYSSGFVSGLESKGAALRWIKTDAWIASGHSGGALVDPANRLVGVPAATLGDLEDLGLAVPASAVPARWRKRIERGQKR